MLSVHCPTCGSTLGLNDDMLGQKVRCGSCKEIFVADAPPPPRSRRDDDEDEDRPRKRPTRRDEDEEDRDRPSRRSRRRDDDEEEDYDDRPRRKPKRRKMRKIAAGKPGLAIAAAILFLIWGGIGAILSLWSIVGLVNLLNLGAPFGIIAESLISTLIAGSFSAFLITSGLRILNGDVEDIASVGTAALGVCCGLLVWSIVRMAMVLPAFLLGFVMTAALTMLLLMSGVIVGGIFCIACSAKYEKWQAS